ncbi:MAG TPA: DUF4359 domain-containing protein [Nitrospira sp.]|jgi:hypothetical protein|nr:DUF4359 domain-containing protein [Nitrospira sp.]
MAVLQLAIVVVALGSSIGLVLSNPSMDEYLAFIETELGKAMDRSDQSQSTREQAMLKTIFRSHSHELINTAVRPHTVRRNWGILSVYETSVFDSRFVVLGVGGSFFPLKGIDEAIIRLGRLAF